MNRNTTYALFGVTFAIVAGMIGNNLLVAQPSAAVEKTPTSDGFQMIGHVTTIVKDASGNIKAYRQTDNTVVATGKNCVSKLLFGPGASRGAAGAGVCTGANTTPWTAIAVGNGSGGVSPGVTDFKLVSEPISNSNGLNRQSGAVTWTNATSGSATALIQATFGPLSGLGSGGTQVTESGLFNSTTVGATGMFAHQGITSIALNNGDSLTIKWTITIG